MLGINILQMVLDAITGLANAMNDAYMWLMVQIIYILTESSLPTVDELFDSVWFMVGAGGTLGAAKWIVTAIAIGVALYSILVPTRRHGQRWGRLVSTVVLVAAFGVAFAPLYTMAYQLSQGFAQSALNLIMGTSDASVVDVVEKLTVQSNLDGVNLIIRFGLLVFAMLINSVVAVQVFCMEVLLYASFITYPLALSLRPFGKKASMPLHILNGGIAATLVAPPVMLFGYALPLMDLFGSNDLFKAFMALIGSTIAVVVPILVFFFVYNKSQEIIGTVQSTVDGGGVDINSAPPLTTEALRDSIDETSQSSLRPFTQASPEEISPSTGLNDADSIDKLRDFAVQKGIAAAMASGHPYVAMGIRAADELIPRNPDSSPPPGGIQGAGDPKSPLGSSNGQTPKSTSGPEQGVQKNGD